MKKLVLVGSIVAVLGLLIAGLTTPIFAHGTDGGGAASDNDTAWEAMHEACESGDWEAMAEAAGEAHGDDFGSMPYHDGVHTADDGWGGMSSHMGRGMMGWY